GAMKAPTADSWSVHAWSKDGVYVAASNDTMTGGPVAFGPVRGGGIFLAGLRAITGLPPAPMQYVNRFDTAATLRWSGTMQALARSGRAYAVLPHGAPGTDCSQRVEILAADGTSCGSFEAAIAAGQCRTQDAALGLDDTPIQLMPLALTPAGSCTYRWWPRAV